MNPVRRVHDHDFADVVLGAATPVVVGFCAGSSSTCEALEQVLDELAASSAGLAVALVDVDRSPQTATTHRVSSVPTVLAFSGGRLLLALPGTPTKDTMLRILELTVPRAAPEAPN